MSLSLSRNWRSERARERDNRERRGGRGMTRKEERT